MSVWGHLEDRYAGKENEPHRMLSLDGGGIRGVLTLGILKHMETLIAKEKDMGDDFRLCQYFDYIAGNSTGAIIAAGLACGMSVDDLLVFYREKGEAMFDKQWLLKRYYSLYKSEPLIKELQAVFGRKATLASKRLQSLVLLVSRNRSTDSTWPMSNNPRAKYNDTSRPDCNLQIPLWKIVRASTAAPVYFPPEVIQWDKEDENKTFIFVDGGITPYNNPAFLLYRMATAPEYSLGWADGEDKLLIMSCGTGNSVTLADEEPDDPGRGIAGNVGGSLGSLMSGASIDQDTSCRHIGRCVHADPLDRELGDMVPRDTAGKKIPLNQDLGRRFLYSRYNAELSRKGLDALGFTNLDPAQVNKLDAVDNVEDLYQIGLKVGEQVSRDHFGSFL